MREWLVGFSYNADYEFILIHTLHIHTHKYIHRWWQAGFELNTVSSLHTHVHTYTHTHVYTGGGKQASK
jgi:hypothetical protein